MGAQSDKGRHEALVEGGGALLGREADEIQGPGELAGFSVHRAGLEDVQRLRHGGSDSTLKKEKSVMIPKSREVSLLQILRLNILPNRNHLFS